MRDTSNLLLNRPIGPTTGSPYGFFFADLTADVGALVDHVTAGDQTHEGVVGNAAVRRTRRSSLSAARIRA